MIAGQAAPPPVGVTSPSVTPGPAPATDAPTPNDAEPAAALDVGALFVGPTPHVPAAFGGLQPGMTVEQARAIAPTAPAEVVATLGEPPRTMELLATWDDGTGTLRALSFHLRGHDAVALATQAWGKPVVVASEDGRNARHHWLDPLQRLRVVVMEVMGGFSVSFEQYLPLEALLGPGEAFAFQASQPLLGATIGALEQAYPTNVRAVLGDEHGFVLPPTEFERGSTIVYLRLDGAGNVRSWSLTLDPRSPAPAVARALLERKLGKPSEDARGWLVYRESKPRIEAGDDGMDGWKLRVSR